MEVAPIIQDARPPCTSLYLGQNQTGKSHLADLHAESWKRRNPEGQVYAIGKRIPGAFWGRGWDQRPVKGEGGYKLVYPLIEKITNYGEGPYRPPHVNPMVGMKGALIRFDDAEGVIPPIINGTPYGPLFNENAHLRCDVQVTGHRPQRFDKDLLLCAHHIYWFPMPESYALEYMAEHPILKMSDVFRRRQLPTKRGQYIHIRQTPGRNEGDSVVFVDGYNPKLDPNARGK